MSVPVDHHEDPRRLCHELRNHADKDTAPFACSPAARQHRKWTSFHAGNVPVKRHRGEPGHTRDTRARNESVRRSQVQSSQSTWVSGDSIRLLRTVFVGIPRFHLFDPLSTLYRATAMHSAFGHRGAASARALRRALDSRSGAARLLAVQAHVSIKYVGGAGG